jgi:hypothetical protein
MKTRSAKNKGKRLQNDVRDLILETFQELEPAESNANQHIPLLVFKRNRSKTYISMEINDLIKILNDKEK